ncbi:hypothetical protein ACPOM7_04295 [Peribacillus castrilensis]|uniref:hypothetical protein n=1 Tax=Bacillaceae TaxID=186817 RepID=UPI000ADAB51E|nr:MULTISPECIES: hypothetical protein [Bacillaceae]MBD8586993.1 hypothetical protein [Peribacillus simplex]MCF7625322.1 hypothetical protein [Peribacillus frigoritolerans]MCP1155857.1 hypothetical protein [Peribacillus frigoritolerans]MCT1387824.1 hypothetical protein [Peribacillus frigoritolerans]MEA3574581.1 hypothetical protein [Peribacillus frigoritolerans]
MTKNVYVLKMVLVFVFPVFTFIYLNDRFGMIPAALGGLILLIALSTLLFFRKEKKVK